MPAFELQALKSPNGIPLKLPELVGAINHRELTIGNKKISAFGILISGNTADWNFSISLLSKALASILSITQIFPAM